LRPGLSTKEEEGRQFKTGKISLYKETAGGLSLRRQVQGTDMNVNRRDRETLTLHFGRPTRGEKKGEGEWSGLRGTLSLKGSSEEGSWRRHAGKKGEIVVRVHSRLT